MAKEITLIIPVYNGEAHLRRCLDSAVGQSHQNYEILVIDDGSTDGSRAICEEYKARFPFLKVIHQEQNRGLIASWQHGVRLAEGDYIAFLDSDDWVDRQYLEALASGIPLGGEIICCSHNRVYGSRAELCREGIPAGCYPKARLLEEVYPVMLNDGTYLGRRLTPHRCGKLFRKGLLTDNFSFCDTEISYGEDLNIFFPAILDCRCLVVLDDPEGLYFYRQNQGSIIHSYKKNMFRQITRLRAHLLDAMEAKAVFDFTDQLNRDYWCLFMEYVKNEARSSHPYEKSGEVLRSCRESQGIPVGKLSLRLSDRGLLWCLKKNSRGLIYAWMKLYSLVRKG